MSRSTKKHDSALTEVYAARAGVFKTIDAPASPTQAASGAAMGVIEGK
jgi:hypothetical protein